MLGSTKAIVLHKTNYSESSIVVQVFTFDFGKVSLLIQGVKRRKSKNKSALFEPLSILELVGNFKNPEKLIKPSEVKIHKPLLQIQSSIGKRSIALFLSEILSKSIREPHPEKEMFSFIETSLSYLDVSNEKTSNFHLVFMLELSRYLGFYPQKSEGMFFDMEEGIFKNSQPLNHYYLTGNDKELFSRILGIKIDKSHELIFQHDERKLLLESILKYYQVHVSGWKEVKSHLILESVFK